MFTEPALIIGCREKDAISTRLTVGIAAPQCGSLGCVLSEMTHHPSFPSELTQLPALQSAEARDPAPQERALLRPQITHYRDVLSSCT